MIHLGDVLATPGDPAYGMGVFHRYPNTMDSLRDTPESFRTGLGHDYDSHGPEAAVGIERAFEPWNRANLLPVAPPALDGARERMAAGTTVADVGCGAGAALLLMADAYPNCKFVGYDISQYALRRAAEKQQEAGTANVSLLRAALAESNEAGDGTCRLPAPYLLARFASWA